MVKIGSNKPNSVYSVQLLPRHDIQRHHQNERTVGTSTPLEVEAPLRSETPWQKQSTGPVARLDMSNDIDSQELPPFPTDRDEQPRGVSFTQPNIEWDELLDSKANAARSDNFRALIARMRNSYGLREWSQLDPHDQSFLNTIRQPAAASLARMAGEYLDDTHPLLPDVVNAARNLFKHGTQHNSRHDRMLAVKIIVNASPFLPSGFKPAYGAASIIREFVEAQATRLVGSEIVTPPETTFSAAARTKPRLPMMTPEFIGMMRKNAQQQAGKRVAAATSETLACMRAYEVLIPRFKPGHTEVMAGILMCGVLIDESSVNELIWTAYEIQGQLTDIQASSNVTGFRRVTTHRI